MEEKARFRWNRAKIFSIVSTATKGAEQAPACRSRYPAAMRRAGIERHDARGGDAPFRQRAGDRLFAGIGGHQHRSIAGVRDELFGADDGKACQSLAPFLGV